MRTVHPLSKKKKTLLVFCQYFHLRLSHRLTFSEERWAVSKDASVQNEDTFDIYDPRNPINKRRREDGKQQQRQKHRRDRTHT